LGLSYWCKHLKSVPDQIRRRSPGGLVRASKTGVQWPPPVFGMEDVAKSQKLVDEVLKPES
jgi:hypothetical protein